MRVSGHALVAELSAQHWQTPLLFSPRVAQIIVRQEILQNPAAQLSRPPFLFLFRKKCCFAHFLCVACVCCHVSGALCAEIGCNLTFRNHSELQRHTRVHTGTCARHVCSPALRACPAKLVRARRVSGFAVLLCHAAGTAAACMLPHVHFGCRVKHTAWPLNSLKREIVPHFWRKRKPL